MPNNIPDILTSEQIQQLFAYLKPNPLFTDEGQNVVPQEGPVGSGNVQPTGFIAEGAIGDILLFADNIRPPEVVTSLPELPNTAYPIGSLVFLTTDSKLYRNANGAWTKEVAGEDIVSHSVTAGQISAGAIGVDELAAGSVTADKLAASIILASLIATPSATGRRVELHPDGLHLHDTDDSILVNIPTNPSQPVFIRGDLIAESLISEESAEFRGPVDIRTGGVAKLENTVANPTTAPQVSVALDSLTLGSHLSNLGHGVYRDSAAGSYWVGADPTTGPYVAHEFNATTGALIRSIPKTGSMATYTTTLGPTGHVSDSAEATSGTSDSQVGVPLTFPSNGYPKRAVRVHAWLAGYTGNQSCKLAIWNAGGTLLATSAAFTAAQKTFTAGNNDKYEKDLTAELSVSDGQTVYAGFLRTTGTPGFWWDKDNGAGGSVIGDGLDGNLTGTRTDTAAKPNVWITYEYDVNTQVEVAKITGVASDGSSVIAALGTDGILHRYNRTDLTYLGASDLSAQIGGAEANTGLTFDGTNFVITTATGTGASVQVRLVKVNTSGVHQSNVNTTGFTINGTTDTIRGGWYDGTTNIWVNVSSQARKYTYSTGAYVSNNEFGSASSMQDGLTHDGTVFRGWAVSSPTKIWKFTDWDWTTESAVYWIGYSWYDSVATTHETLVGPRYSLTMRRRERLLVGTPNIPSGGSDEPNNCRVYMARGAADPGAGGFKLQVTDTGISRFLSTFASGGAADPTSNNFSAGSPAEIRSGLAVGSGGWSLKGDGSITMGGTTFPGSPVSGQLFYRTDRNLLYFYDGTRWLSVTLYQMPIDTQSSLIAFSATNTNQYAQAPWAGVYDLWLEDFQGAFYVVGGTALSGSHKWVQTLNKQPAGTTIATVNIDSGASDTWRNSGQVAIDALLGTTQFALTVLSTKTGTPGDLIFLPTVTYRLVG